MSYEVFIPTFRPVYANEANRGIDGVAKFIDGSNMKCYSRLINQAIQESNAEKVIICNDRARPTPEHLVRISNYLDAGYGLAGLYYFGLYGIKKDLIRKIGFLDERYIKGMYEDGDFVRRCNEADVAVVFVEQANYVTLGTTFITANTYLAKEHFENKWKHEGEYCYRFMPEEDYGYDIGPLRGDKFLPWSESIIEDRLNWYKTVKVTSR